jgi:hypothetical protein
MYLSVREYRDSNNKWDFFFLDYYDSDDFSDALEEDEDLAFFAEKYKEKYNNNLNYSMYRNYFCSTIQTVRYNNDYGYALDRFKDWPLGSIVSGDKFKDLCNIGGKSDDNVVYSIPATNNAKYNNIYQNAKLNQLEDFTNIDTLQIGKKGKKIAYSLTFLSKESEEKINEKIDDSMLLIDSFNETEIEKDFKKFLKAKGILMNNKLIPNGWIYLDSEDIGFDFKLPLKFDGIELNSQGGIILSNGNIYIKENIVSENPSLFLTIIALDGDIIIERGVNKIQASLVSKKGQVRFEKDGDNPIEINGQIIMQNFGDGNKKANQDIGINRRLNLNYINELSALPYSSKDNDSERSEKSLLMFNLKDNPKIH